jgi:Pyruvate/2-oxoacid:ferredoxin oxidoreductase gamma subunit
MTFEELAIRFALALATRPNSDVYETNINAIKAAKDLLQKLEKAQEEN